MEGVKRMMCHANPLGIMHQVEFSGYGFFVQPYSRSRPDFRVGQPTGGHVLSRHVMPMSNSFLHLYEHIGLIIAYASLVVYNCIDLS